MESLDWILCFFSLKSILINGSLLAPFKMRRDLRQGDPLSSFLFVLVGEVFNKMMELAKCLNLVEGINIGQNAVDLSHLQFADDTLVLCPNKKECLTNYRRLLSCFSVMSELQINYSKSASIPFGCEDSWVRKIKNDLWCSIVRLLIIYLGIPLGANPERISTWQLVLNKIEKRLALWKAKFLSRAGWLVLIKSVLNNLPLNYLSIFRIPKVVAQNIINVQRKFFWFFNARKKGITFVSWATIQKPKELGGLGAGDLIIKNAALFFKWCWRFSNKGMPLWKRIVCSNYGTSPKIPLYSYIPSNSSSLWNQISDFLVYEAHFWT